MKKIFVILALFVTIGLVGCLTPDEPTNNNTANRTYPSSNNTNNFTYPSPNNTNTENLNNTGTNISEPQNLEPINSNINFTSSLELSNPKRGEFFAIDIRAETSDGIQSLVWESNETFAKQPDSKTFDCGSITICTARWVFVSAEAGTKIITAYALDTKGGRSAKTPIEINVQAVHKYFACANAICEGGESYQSCPQDCSPSDAIDAVCGDGSCKPGEDANLCSADCTLIKPSCGDNICDDDETQTSCSADCGTVSVTNGTTSGQTSCSTNSDCDGYRQICSSGQCIDVECKTDSHCGSHEYCSYNSCVRCRRDYKTGNWGC